jgi:hypothetical protein
MNDSMFIPHIEAINLAKSKELEFAELPHESCRSPDYRLAPGRDSRKVVDRPDNRRHNTFTMSEVRPS